MIFSVLLFALLVILVIALCFSAAGLLLRILYFLCIALPLSLLLGTLGIVLCCTIIGIPLGLSCLRGAGSLFFSFI